MSDVSAGIIRMPIEIALGDDLANMQYHTAALSDIAAVVAAYNECKSSPMTTKLRMAIERLERGLERAGGGV